MSKVPDAWEDEWSTVADEPSTVTDPTSKKVSSKVTKAQRRAQNSEFNKQLWAEAETPQEPNYFLQSRNVVPLRSEFKPPPVLLSRKGPIIHTRPNPDGNANINSKQESSEDEELDEQFKSLSTAERQAQSARVREEKQRKYEERRQELFGKPNTANAAVGSTSRSGNSSPSSLTPPGSRSATPNRGKARGARRGGGGGGNTNNTAGLQTQQTRLQQPQRELYDPSYTPKVDSTYIQRRRDNETRSSRGDEIQPIRPPKGPDGSGRGGFGFVNRGGHHITAQNDKVTVEPSIDT